MKINDFTEIELDVFRKLCNFDEEELQYFNMRARNKSNVEISLAMSVSESKVSKLARRVKEKMKRIL